MAKSKFLSESFLSVILNTPLTVNSIVSGDYPYSSDISYRVIFSKIDYRNFAHFYSCTVQPTHPSWTSTNNLAKVNQSNLFPVKTPRSRNSFKTLLTSFGINPTGAVFSQVHRIKCYEEVANVLRECHNDVARKLLPWNVTFSPSGGGRRLHARAFACAKRRLNINAKRRKPTSAFCAGR